jgi:hypothetical protein
VVRIDIADSQYAQVITGKKIPQIVHALTAKPDSTHRKLLTCGDCAIFTQSRRWNNIRDGNRRYYQPCRTLEK